MPSCSIQSEAACGRGRVWKQIHTQIVTPSGGSLLCVQRPHLCMVKRALTISLAIVTRCGVLLHTLHLWDPCAHGHGLNAFCG